LSTNQINLACLFCQTSNRTWEADILDNKRTPTVTGTLFIEISEKKKQGVPYYCCYPACFSQKNVGLVCKFEWADQRNFRATYLRLPCSESNIAIMHTPSIQVTSSYFFHDILQDLSIYYVPATLPAA